MFLVWGPKHTLFYNDAFAPLLGGTHLGALGEELRTAVPILWEAIGERLVRTMDGAGSALLPSMPFFVERSGYREEAYFHVSLSTVEDDYGMPSGVLGVATEVTQSVLASRRTRCLRDIAEPAPRSAPLAERAMEFCRSITNHSCDVAFALVYVHAKGPNESPHGELALAAASGTEGACAFPPSVPLGEDEESAMPLARAFGGRTTIVDGLADRVGLRGGIGGDFVRTAILLPLRFQSDSNPFGVLVVGLSPNRALDEGYSAFLELIALSCVVSLADAKQTLPVQTLSLDSVRFRRCVAELDHVRETLVAVRRIASDELHEPLRVMSNYAQLLHRRASDSLTPENQRYVEHIVEAAKKGYDSIVELLQKSQPDSKPGEA